jgi:D-glycero-alpha-D-manno-heptose-7-phosphate kinase
MARARAAGATAAKVCGAGGGGCLICIGPPRARASVAEALGRGGARILDYRVDMEGLRFG